MGDNGCKTKENVGKILGKCDIQCFEDLDCKNDEVCEDNICNKNSNDLMIYPSKKVYTNFALFRAS